MRQAVQEFAKSLLDHSRTSQELEIMLNYSSITGVDPSDVWEPGDHQSLDRLKLAINYKQKQFVAHPSVQQLLASIWYEGESNEPTKDRKLFSWKYVVHTTKVCRDFDEKI